MCEVLSGEGVSGCVTKCDRGGGSKLAKNSVMYFMDGPWFGFLALINITQILVMLSVSQETL